eukprot:531522_1
MALNLLDGLITQISRLFDSMEPTDEKLPVIDWSTREKTQEWFTARAAGFNPSCQKNMKYKDMLGTYADDIIDINWWGAFYGKPDLIKDLEKNLSTSVLKSWKAYFDVEIWSKDQVIVDVIYEFVGINNEQHKFRGSLLVRPTDKKKQISLWIYTSEQAIMEQTCTFFEKLNKYKS